MTPDVRAACKSFSSTMPPRAVLTRYAVGFMRFNRSLAPTPSQQFSLPRSSTVLEQLPRINLKTFRNAGNVIDGNISFSPLNRTQVSSVDTAFVCEGLLAKPSRGAQPSHVLCQDVPQRSFVRPFHGRDFCGLTVLRRPVLFDSRPGHPLDPTGPDCSSNSREEIAATPA